MAIDSPGQIRFSNTLIRPIADCLGKISNQGPDISQRWTTLGANQAALDVMRDEINKMAKHFETCYLKSVLVTNADEAFMAPVPNTTDIVEDGAGTGDGRPIINGQDLNSIITLATEFVNWLKTGTVDASGSDDTGLKGIIIASITIDEDLTVTQASDFIAVVDTIVGDYQANTNAKSIKILKVAVNP